MITSNNHGKPIDTIDLSEPSLLVLSQRNCFDLAVCSARSYVSDRPAMTQGLRTERVGDDIPKMTGIETP